MTKYFAEIDSTNIVLRVLAFADDKDIQWITERLSGQWIESSKEIRKTLAGVGNTYDSEKDEFIRAKPFPSWILNEENFEWEAPTPKPDGDYYWDEETTSWVEVPEAE